MVPNRLKQSCGCRNIDITLTIESVTSESRATGKLTRTEI